MHCLGIHREKPCDPTNMEDIHQPCAGDLAGPHARPFAGHATGHRVPVRIPLTCGYHGRPVGNASMIMPNNGTASTSRQASDLVKRLKVELRGLEPLASCMPCNSRKVP